MAAKLLHIHETSLKIQLEGFHAKLEFFNLHQSPP